MSIKIIAQEQLAQQTTNSIIKKIPLLFYPLPNTLYIHRAERLRSLAKQSPLSDYLNFCASIAERQANIVKHKPIQMDLADALHQDQPPLSLDALPLTTIWQDYLTLLLTSFAQTTSEIAQTIEQLQQNSVQQLQDKALSLLTGKFEQVAGNESLFIWSALSVYYSQLASQIKGTAIAENTDKHWFCPVCNSLPVDSVIQLGNNSGLRYLHCSLCESEWYVPRIKCTSCDNMQDIQYFSLENELAAIKTECCEVCHGYLKILDQDKDPHIEVVADDIASLILDMKTEEEGFAKSGMNPFVFS